MLVFGYGVVTKNQLLILEETYRPFDVTVVSSDLRKEIRYIVVLGSGHVSDSRLPATVNPPAGTLFPSTNNLSIAKRIIYEWIGTIWSQIKRIIENSP